MKLAIQCPIFLGEFRCHPDTLAPGIAMVVVSEAQLLSWSRTGKPPGWGSWGPKWAQNGPKMDIWMTFDGTMVIQGWIWWLFLFFRQTQLNHEAWLNVFSAWIVFHRHVFKLAFSAHSELTFWVSRQPGFPGAKTSGSRWWSCRSEWQAWLGMALRKGASISWVKLGWLVQIRLVLTNLVTRKPLVHHHVISCPVVFFVHFWGHIKNRSPDQAANQRTAPSSVYIS